MTRARLAIGLVLGGISLAACSSSQSVSVDAIIGGGGMDAGADGGPTDSGGGHDAMSGLDGGRSDGGGGPHDATTTPDAAMIGKDAMTGGMDAIGGGMDANPPSGPEVLQHHNHITRDGVYVDPAFTRAAAATIHMDATFTAPVNGAVYAQPLYVSNGPMGKDALFVVTENNEVIAIDAANGSVLWTKTVATPVSSGLPCGNISPLGITGTPIVDKSTRTIYFDAMTTQTTSPIYRHLIYALSIDDGATKSGYPIDVGATVHGTSNLAFVSAYQNERGALALVDGILYVPYGGHWGDCTNAQGTAYHGWIVGVDTTNPMNVLSWATRALAGGIWSPGGVSSDGTNLYAVTGNTFNTGGTYGDGEAIVRLQRGPTFSGQNTDFYAPSNWLDLDGNDADLTGTAPIIIDVPGATPSQLVFTLGKDGRAYLANRTNLGGIGGQILSQFVSNDVILSTASAYTTQTGTYVVWQAACPPGQLGDLSAFKITATNPPALNFAWCASMGSNGGYSGSPMVTMTDSHGTDAIVWVASAEGDGKLRGFNADTGQVIFDGGGTTDAITNVQHFQVPIAINGRIFVAGNDHLFAMTVR